MRHCDNKPYEWYSNTLEWGLVILVLIIQYKRDRKLLVGRDDFAPGGGQFRTPTQRRYSN